MYYLNFTLPLAALTCFLISEINDDWYRVDFNNHSLWYVIDVMIVLDTFYMPFTFGTITVIFAGFTLAAELFLLKYLNPSTKLVTIIFSFLTTLFALISILMYVIRSYDLSKYQDITRFGSGYYLEIAGAIFQIMHLMYIYTFRTILD